MQFDLLAELVVVMLEMLVQWLCWFPLRVDEAQLELLAEKAAPMLALLVH